ncbi:CBU_0592 family membrane protein [Corynebacterium spheniscorum]|uniref:CBU-0592-like domain-containing protein n=1 Tax=Corynebacterium spheniscorum TaxID=185761 RepID=A0A1I2SKV4_9CORY|nr:hypothetical protein [Corynebacterium spheniscorum]KAA8724010.1 transporter [Corynebacterium spheniscorum]SFG52359.1 hypothetical protein SAMN05660282_01144 [Corynebacterium spheniscorum]
MPFAQAVSLIGSVMLLGAYGLLNLGKFTPQSYGYQWMNVIGAAGLTYSVIEPLNVGVFITELIWTLIGLVGVFKIWMKNKKDAQAGVTTTTSPAV